MIKKVVNKVAQPVAAPQQGQQAPATTAKFGEVSGIVVAEMIKTIEKQTGKKIHQFNLNSATFSVGINFDDGKKCSTKGTNE